MEMVEIEESWKYWKCGNSGNSEDNRYGGDYSGNGRDVC